MTKKIFTAAEIAAIAAKPNLTVEEACAIANIGRTALYAAWAADTGPETFRLGYKRLISRAALDAWLAGQEKAKPEPRRPAKRGKSIPRKPMPARLRLVG